MSLGLGWKLHGDGNLSGPDDVVAPDERLGWGKTVGLGAQHVVAMFGATFVFPLIMGLNAQLAIMMSGIATIAFLLIVQGKVPSYLGTSASFVGGVVAIRAQEGATSATVTGAILVAGVVLALVGVLIHFLGSQVLHTVLPPVVTGAVVMLIGFNLAPVVANIYWPQDQWVALLVMTFVIICAVAFKGFIGRIAIFLALIFGYVAVLAVRQGLRPDHRLRRGRRQDHDPLPHQLPGHQGRRLVRLPAAHRDRRRQGDRGLARPVVLDRGHPAGDPRRDRAHRREHRSRQGGRRDDQDRPRPRDGPGHRRRRRRHRARLGRRRLAHHHLRREHRGHGRDPGLLDRGLLRRGRRRDPLRAVAEVRRARRVHPGRRARRDHRGPLRHDRPARRQDLEGERRRLRQPDQPRAGRGRHRHRHRRRDAEVLRQLLPLRHRARHDRGRRGLPPGQGAGPGRAAGPADGAVLTVGGGTPTATATGSTTSTRATTAADPCSRPVVGPRSRSGAHAVPPTQSPDLPPGPIAQ